MSTNIVVFHYAVYILISAFLIIWVGKTLSKHGRVFLSDAFDYQEAMVDSVSQLVIVGFYLVNFGIVSLFLQYGDKPADLVGSIERMSSKIGVILLLLVLMHFLNVVSLAKLRSRFLRKQGAESSSGRNLAAKPTATARLEPEALDYAQESVGAFSQDGQELALPAANSAGH